MLTQWCIHVLIIQVIIRLDTGLSRDRHHAIIWTNADILLIDDSWCTLIFLMESHQQLVVIGLDSSLATIDWLIILFTRLKGTQKSIAYLAGTLYNV